MEYCEETLRHWLLRRDAIEEINWNDNMSIFQQIVAGVVLFHGLDIIHRYLKPENIFMNSSCQVHIGEFGLARFLPVGAANSASSTYSSPELLDLSRGIWTYGYAAPEQIKGWYYDQKVSFPSFSLSLLFSSLYTS
jgi:serine/threonine protein kinase